VLTHWKERETTYRHRRERILNDQGVVAPYAATGADVEPAGDRARRRAGRITAPEPEGVSAAEFEQMKRDLDIEREPTRHTSTLTKRLARTEEGDEPAAPRPKPARPKPTRGRGGRTTRGPAPVPPGSAPPSPPSPAAPARAPDPSDAPVTNGPVDAGPVDDGGVGDGFQRAPDVAENEGMSPQDRPARPAKPRNRRHGRRR
jgi:hypothetical protein